MCCQHRGEAFLEAARWDAAMSLDPFPAVLCVENLMYNVDMEEFLPFFHLR